MRSANQLSMREWALLFVLILLGTGFGFHYWLLSPLWERNAAAHQQLLLAEQELRLRQEWLQQDQVTQASLAILTEEQAALQALLDDISHQQDVIDYVVQLSQRTRCQVESLEIEEEQVKISVRAADYENIRSFVWDMEQSPNLVPFTVVVLDNQESFSLELEAGLTRGQLPPERGQVYERNVPFGR